ncbi:alpha-mannosidase [Paenibacillus sp. SYP-B4298]|uniref:alpha-mannosidase n=1 Tax=Paenibacillus sp. SYP-B4298 TaxID=2996034 RepID=UPI0022DE8C48|nr:alpha-mannosidase [Paenibacillus sp. SYP-B4298]
MTTAKTAHLISHTHWDREWYMPYEYHHVLLVELMDKLLETLEHDPDYRYFHLDGQTIIIEDYLQVRPEQREKLEGFIRSGRIHIGPWYVLQDEFLTSSEANIRNLLTGHRDAAPFGVISKTGYFPDSFGNMGQAPQILQQAGIDNALFGRGVKPTGFNNMVGQADTYESPYSEMIWRSPDGSSVLGVLFANWYCNGMEVPTDKDEARRYWDQKLAEAESFASTPQLLFMNGCDHQPIQTDLSEAIRTARELYPDITFQHSNFDDYLAALKQQLPDDLVTIEGELRSQRTDGWGTLVNTASARIYLKQMNQLGQTLLEKVAEPLAAFAHIDGGLDYPHHLLRYGWKTLMQNHPHDSICGCSVDEVHREMVTRFDKSRHVAKSIIDQSAQAIVKAIDTASVAAWGKEAAVFTIFNTTGWARSGTVSAELTVAKKYFPEGPSPSALARELEQLPLASWGVLDHAGKLVDAHIEDLGVHFGYELPKDRFRQPYMGRKVKVTLHVADIASMGYASYALVADAKAKCSGTLVPFDSVQVRGLMMENGRLVATVEENGSLTLLDKQSGRTYSSLNLYENTGDIGNEYVYRQPAGESAMTTEGLRAVSQVVEQSSTRAVIESTLHWSIPARADEQFAVEKKEMVPFTERTAQRVKQTVPLILTTRYILEAGSGMVQVETRFNNQAQDHRLRALFPSGIRAEQHEVDSIFEVARRDTKPAPEWTNPSNCQHQQAFVSVSDHKHGLTIANQGLNEYEVLQDDAGTIAVTLLRAVSELGDWGVFETPEAQCQGEQFVQYAILPHGGNGIESGAYAQAYQYQVPWTWAQTDVHAGSLPPVHQWLQWTEAASADAATQRAALALSAVKLSEAHNDLIVRWYNMSGETVSLSASAVGTTGTPYESDILERRHQPLTDEPQAVGKYKIVTRAYPLA